MRRREPASLAAGPAVDENRDMRLHSRFATGFAGLVLLVSPATLPGYHAQPRSHRQSNRAHRSHPQTHRRGGIRAITAASYDAAVLANSPAAFWDMSRTSASEADLTGHGHTGTYEDGIPRAAILPDGGVAADFNGAGQYMTVSSSAAFSIPARGALTWEGWIRPDALQWPAQSDPDGYGYVDWMGKCQSYSPTCEWESRMYSTVNAQGRCNRLSAYVFNPTAGLGSAADFQPTCGLAKPGQWLYVVGEYELETTPSPCSSAYPGTINIWVNGVKWNASHHYPTGCFSQHEISPRATTSPLNVGTMARDTWFPGAVGKVAIYDHLLTQAQISAHYAAMTDAQPQGRCASTCSLAMRTR